jgi:hypothetical protein
MNALANLFAHVARNAFAFGDGKGPFLFRLSRRIGGFFARWHFRLAGGRS